MKRIVPWLAAAPLLLAVAAVAAVPASATQTTAPTIPAASPAPIGVAAPVTSGGGLDVTKATSVAPVRDGRAGASITIYAEPNTSKPIAKVTNLKNVYGRAVFTVIEDQEAWLKVSAPIRQNGGVGYIQASLVTRFLHDWKITVDISDRLLTVTKGDEVVLTERVAVGTKKTPTPLGRFYTVDLVRPKKAGGPYGAFAYGISGFSAVYQKFGAGDGRIGIHGTNDPAKLGTAVSNGCIRVSNAGITKMKKLLPLGVPVEIVE